MIGVPFLITIPHGGSKIPVEVKDRLAITQQQIFEDVDPYSREIYAIDGIPVIAGDTARCVVDLNRDRKKLPPANSDGVVKSQTSLGLPIYKPGSEPDEALIQHLIRRYYDPYHRKIVKALTSTDVKLSLDCHTMPAVGPKFAADPGQVRPTFCLNNIDGQTCPDEMIQILAECLRTAFELNEEEVTVNKHFLGGYITRFYGNRPCPWIQVEMNRNLYLAEPWYNSETQKVSPDRLAWLRKTFSLAMMKFGQKMNDGNPHLWGRQKAESLY